MRLVSPPRPRKGCDTITLRFGRWSAFMVLKVPDLFHPSSARGAVSPVRNELAFGTRAALIGGVGLCVVALLRHRVWVIPKVTYTHRVLPMVEPNVW